MTAEQWQRIVRVIHEAFDDYETGLVILRRRVVANLKRRLSDSIDIERPNQDGQGERPRS